MPVAFLYSEMSSMLMTGKPWAMPKAVTPGSLAMVPSILVSSHRTPQGLKPARRQMSTVASVWPRLAL